MIGQSTVDEPKPMQRASFVHYFHDAARIQRPKHGYSCQNRDDAAHFKRGAVRKNAEPSKAKLLPLLQTNLRAGKDLGSRPQFAARLLNQKTGRGRMRRGANCFIAEALSGLAIKKPRDRSVVRATCQDHGIKVSLRLAPPQRDA